jgi:hypothetical protein
MAIPGYAPTTASPGALALAGKVASKTKTDAINALAEYFNMPFASVDEVWDELEHRCNTSEMPNLLLSDGTLDLGLIYPITGSKPSLLSEVKMVGHPGMAGNPPVIATGFVQGQFTIFFGQYADLYVMQATQVVPADLITPKLSITATSGFAWSNPGSLQGGGKTVESLSFLATFMTPYGETQASNIVTIDRVMYWGSVTLEVNGEAIPAYAGTVRYYRLFGDVFRLVAEVKI